MYKITVQLREPMIKGRRRHIKNFTVFVKDITEFETGIEKFIQRYNQYKTEEIINRSLNKKKKKFFKSDLFDKKAVGKDIGNEEFLKNEIFFETLRG